MFKGREQFLYELFGHLWIRRNSFIASTKNVINTCSGFKKTQRLKWFGRIRSLHSKEQSNIINSLTFLNTHHRTCKYNIFKTCTFQSVTCTHKYPSVLSCCHGSLYKHATESQLLCNFVRDSRLRLSLTVEVSRAAARISRQGKSSAVRGKCGFLSNYVQFIRFVWDIFFVFCGDGVVTVLECSLMICFWQWLRLHRKSPCGFRRMMMSIAERMDTMPLKWILWKILTHLINMKT